MNVKILLFMSLCISSVYCGPAGMYICVAGCTASAKLCEVYAEPYGGFAIAACQSYYVACNAGCVAAFIAPTV